MAVTKRIDLESVDNRASRAMRTYVLLSHRRPGLVLGKLDGVVGGQAAALSVEPRQQIGHSVAQTVPRLGLRAEARAGRHDPRHRRALLQHAADCLGQSDCC